ncbi:MAG: hypothetical protein A2751_03085 [Candidatus Doudnabacteria bacterium RIFCSPHIGHO2_01_FULL_46_14]|uniref:Glycosyl transferase family 9 n=1 Tax=Candidatus Doudnabacteria bacterium RIFCSPHIGHO2_01_FULL_46_14 TaxID=1817824 RepID=A0A1F5NK90_9BACT|nr:MAG: hypothetical protein A2751_03085 [Candidatus Doudnabacteria bacterium RIFCSPHIGHO2_01_FULL_46_14]
MKILVAQPGKIGDLVCTTPLFRTLAENFKAPVDIIAGPFALDLLKGNDSVREVYSRKVEPDILRKENYTHILVLMPSVEIWGLARKASISNIWSTIHPKMTRRERLFSFFYLTRKFPYNFSSAQQHYLQMGQALGAANLIQKREIRYGSEDEQKIAEFLREQNLQDKKLVGISVTAGKDFKEWGNQNYKQLVDKLNSENFTVIAVGTKEERPKLETLQNSLARQDMFLNVAGDFKLSEFAALAVNFRAFIAADTGPLYIADALGIPVVDLMGPCYSGGQKPLGENAVLIGECLKPEHPKCRMMDSPNYLKEEFQRCMAEIRFEEVWQGFQSLKL